MICYRILSIITLASFLSIAQPDRNLDVPFVPTPYETVRGMLDMAEVNSGDILYDLGCGDGRIVITAVKEYGAQRGVGIDLDPRRIRESRENAQRANVTEKVRFIEGDLFEADFSEATVLTMYLLPDVNLRLRPKIFTELRPGTRIVSHDFDMGTWEADKKKRVGNSTIYFWILPANVSGTWNWNLPVEYGGERYKLQVTQRFQTVSALPASSGTFLKVATIDISGNTLEMVLTESEIDSPPGEQSRKITLRGTVQGDQINGVMIVDNDEISWQALREKGSMSPIFLDESEI